MNAKEKNFVQALTFLLFGLMIFFTIGIAFWAYPRTIIAYAEFMKPTKSTYAVGEPITVTGATQTNVNGTAVFDVRLICGGVKYSYTSISGLNVKKQTEPSRYAFTFPKIPVNVPEGKCRIDSTANYGVEILPLMTRHYIYTFKSDTFNVTK